MLPDFLVLARRDAPVRLLKGGPVCQFDFVLYRLAVPQIIYVQCEAVLVGPEYFLLHAVVEFLIFDVPGVEIYLFDQVLIPFF